MTESPGREQTRREAIPQGSRSTTLNPEFPSSPLLLLCLRELKDGMAKAGVMASASLRPERTLALVPMTLREANAFVEEHHRHHGPARGCLFVIGAQRHGVVVGVCIVGRPVARMRQDGYTAEVTRLCTDGTRNACSMLYAAAWRAAKALGYHRVGTYILEDEDGASLKAAGWTLIGERGGGSWSVPSRPRVDTHPLQGKLLWEAA